MSAKRVRPRPATTVALFTTMRLERKPPPAVASTAGSNALTPSAAAVARAATRTKLVRQPYWPPTTVPRGTPTNQAMLTPIVRTERARPRIPGGANPAATAEATGVKRAAPHAATTLVPSSMEKLGASAAATLASANNIRAPPNRRLLSTPLAAETRKGEPIAKVTANTVTRSPAPATDTERASAMSGSTPVTTKAPVPTAKEPTDRMRTCRTIACLRLLCSDTLGLTPVRRDLPLRKTTEHPAGGASPQATRGP